MQTAKEILQKLRGLSTRTTPATISGSSERKPEPERPVPGGWQEQPLTPEQLTRAHQFGEEMFRRELWQLIKDEHYNWQLWLQANPPPPPVLTASELYEAARLKLRQMVEGRGKVFHETEGLRWLLTVLSEYYAQDAAFEDRFIKRKDGSQLYYSHRKGLLLQGRTGRGKSSFFELFKKTARGGIVSVACRDVVTYYEGGLDEQKQKIGGRAAVLSKYGRSGTFCFDDLGDEPPEGIHFGTRLDVMENVLESRWRAYDEGKLRGFDTHITTNLALRKPEPKPGEAEAPNGLFEVYGTRIFSRIQDMFNVIVIPADVPDYRTL